MTLRHIGSYRDRVLLIIATLLLSTSLSAQSEANQSGYGLRGSLDKRSFWIELNYNYTISKNVYLLAGGVYQKTIIDLPNSFYGTSPDGKIKWSSNDTGTETFMLRGAVGLAIPFFTSGDRQWSVNLEPSIIIQPFAYALNKIECREYDPKDMSNTLYWKEPVSKGVKLGYLFYALDISIKYRRDNISYSIGYGIGNQDPYKTLKKVIYRETAMKKFLPDQGWSGRIFAEATIYF